MFIPQSTTATPNALPRLGSDGKITAAQSQVASVAGKVGVVALVVADVSGAQDTAQKAQANGYASLDGSSKVVQEPASKGQASGIASLDGSSKVVQEPASKGQANGVASLDGGGKVPLSQLPDTVVGAVEYMGSWNASTNTPALPGTPGKGDYYVVSVAGSTNLSGITDWKVGDWAIYNGTAWEKIDNTDAVASVFGRTGAVTAQNGDYSVSQITGAEAVANKGQANGYAGLDGSARMLAANLPATALVADGSVGYTGQQFFSGTRRRINAKSAAYTIVATDEVVPVTAGAGGVAITLPAATGSGAEYKVSKEDAAAGVVTVTADAGGTPDTINGAPTFVLQLQYEAATFVDIGPDKWRVF